ncbi:hypothetical protein HMPREF0860_2316 [Treponema socranskii subsp. socranskii VPI DR56BR1116 = ATCC 35536]|nr:hypothetical protein HMPREF0860_2316 [Treponema socranskii subsp. socranskii VPI DR56BR1116 = ATCC 35536]
MIQIERRLLGNFKSASIAAESFTRAAVRFRGAFQSAVFFDDAVSKNMSSFRR